MEKKEGDAIFIERIAKLCIKWNIDIHDSTMKDPSTQEIINYFQIYK